MVAVLGRYRVLKHLTSGGMADVLLGRADGIEGFERHVVLKRIRAEHARDRRFISMFVDEARLAAGLHHQSIVQVFDIGEDNGEYFFAMEYIHGEDLRRLLAAVAKARTHVPLQIVCALVSAAASALHYAHERRDAKGKPLNIVHRDVSPSNILIGYDGGVKVVDFGIAKATVRKSETVAGSLKGKFSYMSPEQCRGGNIDRRSDVYGLGVLLYELATTSRLFKGDNEYVVMDSIVNGRLTLPQVRRPDLPNELSTIIMRAIATDPARRYQTADDLRVELDDFAARNFGAVTAATLASYMKKIFGARPEPWLDLSAPERPSASTWDAASGDARDSRRSGSLPPRPSAPDLARRASANETAPTQRFGWEAAARMKAARGSKLAWIAAAGAVIGGIAIWKLAVGGEQPATVASAPASTAAADSSLPPVVAVLPAETAPAPDEHAATAAQASTTEPAPEAPVRAVRKVERKPVDKPAVETVPETAAAPPAVEPPAAAPPPAPVAEPAKIEAAAPAPLPAAAPAAPKEPELTIPTLSNATVSSIASDHAAQLAKCEAGATLKGDVTVSFQIDGSGKVVKSQLASTIKNPKVAACILRAVQSWKFARPPSGAAKGVYTISYQ